MLHDKFYFFDCGVVRALTGRLPYPPTAEELGPLAETFVLTELRAYLGYSGLNCRLCFWRSYDGAEVDVLCETTLGFVAIEIKASSRWLKRYNHGMHRIRDDLGAGKTGCYGVYLGERPAMWDDVRVLPHDGFSQTAVGRRNHQVTMRTATEVRTPGNPLGAVRWRT